MKALLLILLVPWSPPPVQCDRIELNTTIRGGHLEPLHQAIFWDRNDTLNRWEVMEFAVGGGTNSLAPYRLSGRWALQVLHRGGFYRVDTRDLLFTATLVDPELENREVVPIADREPLFISGVR